MLRSVVTSPLSVTLEPGQAWVTSVATDPIAATVTATVTHSATEPVTLTPESSDRLGTHYIRYVPTAGGLYVLTITITSDDLVDTQRVIAWVNDITATTGSPYPTLDDIRAYLGNSSATDAELLSTLRTEIGDQRNRCDVPAAFPPELYEALLRRVARNLAARSVPIASFTTLDIGGRVDRIDRFDSEIDRFEGPHRKWVIG